MSCKNETLLILIGILSCLLFSGCATYQYSQIKQSLNTDKANGYYIKDFQFENQKENWCGPAALSSVLQYWGEDITQEEVAEEVYLPNIKGTLTIDLENYAYNKGYFAQVQEADILELGSRIRADIPVIVMHKVLPIFSSYHYLVVFGYDDTHHVMLVYSGKKEAKVIGYPKFMQKWQGANRWMLTIAPPQNVTWQLTPYNMNKLGLLFERKGELNRAQAQYKEALQSEPANATYSYNSANIYLKKQQYDEAINYYEKAISNDSKLADAYNNLAYALCKKKENLEKAEDYVKKAITLKPENKPYYLDTLGLIYFNKGQINKAIEIYKKAVELTEKDKQALIILYTHLQQAYERKNSHKMYEIYQDKINDLKKDLTKNKG